MRELPDPSQSLRVEPESKPTSLIQRSSASTPEHPINFPNNHRVLPSMLSLEHLNPSLQPNERHAQALQPGFLKGIGIGNSGANKKPKHPEPSTGGTSRASDKFWVRSGQVHHVLLDGRVSVTKRQVPVSRTKGNANVVQFSSTFNDSSDYTCRSSQNKVRSFDPEREHQTVESLGLPFRHTSSSDSKIEWRAPLVIPLSTDHDSKEESSGAEKMVDAPESEETPDTPHLEKQPFSAPCWQFHDHGYNYQRPGVNERRKQPSSRYSTDELSDIDLVDDVPLAWPSFHYTETFSGERERQHPVGVVERYLGNDDNSHIRISNYQLRDPKTPPRVAKKVSFVIPQRRSSRNVLQRAFNERGQYTKPRKKVEWVEGHMEGGQIPFDEKDSGAFYQGEGRDGDREGQRSTVDHKASYHNSEAFPERDAAGQQIPYEHGINPASLRSIQGFGPPQSHKRQPIARD